jgi:DNA-binding NtrC family response regulator
MTDVKRILVADDEEVIRQACVRILTRAGYDVSTAVNGDEALRQIRNGNIDLVLLDIKMPVLDGMKVLNILSSENSETRVVVITGHGTAATAAQAVKAGASDFLTKPFSPSELRNSVHKALAGTPHLETKAI